MGIVRRGEGPKPSGPSPVSSGFDEQDLSGALPSPTRQNRSSNYSVPQSRAPHNMHPASAPSFKPVNARKPYVRQGRDYRGQSAKVEDYSAYNDPQPGVGMVISSNNNSFASPYDHHAPAKGAPRRQSTATGGDDMVYSHGPVPAVRFASAQQSPRDFDHQGPVSPLSDMNDADGAEGGARHPRGLVSFEDVQRPPATHAANASMPPMPNLADLPPMAQPPRTMPMPPTAYPAERLQMPNPADFMPAPVVGQANNESQMRNSEVSEDDMTDDETSSVPDYSEQIPPQFQGPEQGDQRAAQGYPAPPQSQLQQQQQPQQQPPGPTGQYPPAVPPGYGEPETTTEYLGEKMDSPRGSFDEGSEYGSVPDQASMSYTGAEQTRMGPGYMGSGRNAVGMGMGTGTDSASRHRCSLKCFFRHHSPKDRWWGLTRMMKFLTSLWAGLSLGSFIVMFIYLGAYLGFKYQREEGSPSEADIKAGIMAGIIVVGAIACYNAWATYWTMYHTSSAGPRNSSGVSLVVMLVFCLAGPPSNVFKQSSDPNLVGLRGSGVCSLMVLGGMTVAPPLAWFALRRWLRFVNLHGLPESHLPVEMRSGQARGGMGLNGMTGHGNGNGHGHGYEHGMDVNGMGMGMDMGRNSKMGSMTSKMGSIAKRIRGRVQDDQMAMMNGMGGPGMAPSGYPSQYPPGGGGYPGAGPYGAEGQYDNQALLGGGQQMQMMR